MTEQQVLVIGAGHNGLVCAAYLAAAGHKVLVLEAADHPGGAAATREFVPGYKVSACAHLLYSLDARIVKELDLPAHGLQFAAEELQTVALHEHGSHLTFSADGVAGEGVPAQDIAALAAFRARMDRFAALLDKSYARRPPRLKPGDWRELADAARLALDMRRLGREDMRELMRIAVINIYDVLEENFEDERLKGALAFDAVLGTHLGPRSNNSVLNYLHRLTGGSSRWRGGCALPRGGMGALAGALAGAARARGAQLRTGARVARILLDGARVSGVALENGEEISASLVVSNADPKTTLFGLVGAAALEAGFARRVHNIRMRGNAARLHLALDGAPEFTGLGAAGLGQRLLIAPDTGYLERAFDCAKYGRWSEAPAIELVIPSVHDASLAPSGAHVLSATVQYAPYALRDGWDDAARSAFEQRVIEVIAAYAPGLRERIVASELLTPLDIEQKFGISGGHWHHGELAFDQFLMLRPVPGAARYATPVGGLYLCGAGSHPGGNLTGIPGRNAARELIARERRA